ncbi:MAG: MFS transporter [Hyphomicrobiaceae bacterium]
MQSTDLQSGTAPGWRSPIAMLMLLAVANALSFQVWMALLNNFAVNEAGFTGWHIGVQQSVREIPGLLAFTAILVLILIREQSLALLSLVALAAGTALTGFFPTPLGLYLTTLLMSFGFHYYHTVQQSLSLQWLPKGQAAQGLGRIISAESFATLAALGLVFVIFRWLDWGYQATYVLAGLVTLAITLFAWLRYPRFPQAVEQHQSFVLRRRYGLYYALTFLDGARRQIFIVFASFMMVEKFHYSVADITLLFLVNHMFNMVAAPVAGRLVSRFGERTALTLEYSGLLLVFTAYAFVQDPWIAAALYLIDHAFFAMSMASPSYFQKIADPADIAPSAAVSFSINHIAAIVLPVSLGIVWVWNPAAVFLLGSGFAVGSLALARLIPRHPAPGHEISWLGAPVAQPSK